MKKQFLAFILSLHFFCGYGQTVKVLFSANKGEQAGNADWIIDADVNNLFVTSSGTYTTTGDESNAQRIPTPAQSGITATTSEGYWKGALSAFGVECAKLGYIVESMPITGQITYGNTSNAQDLSNYRIYVVCEPNIVFTTAEKTAIMNYIQNGGRLLMVADHETSDRNGDGWESRTIWNDLMYNNSVNSNNPFGMKFDSVDIFQTSSNYTSNAMDSILNSTQFGSVTQMKFANGTTLTINPSLNPTVKGHFYSTGASRTNTSAWVASSRFGKGKVVGFGDSSPFDDGTGDVNDNLFDGWITDASGNHRKIIMNAMLWLAALDSFYVNISATKSKICFDKDSSTLTATQGVNYSWSNGKTTQSIKVYAGGVYTVTVTNNLGQQTTKSITISEYNRPNPVVTIAGNKVQTTNTFINYQWFKLPNPISGATAYQYTPTISGVYFVLVVDSNGCQDTSNVVNFTYPPFTVSISKSKDSVCEGDSILLSTTLGSSYQWSNGKTSQSIYVKTSGNYSVTVTNGSGLTATNSMSVYFHTKPNPSVTISGNTLSASNTFSTYQWYNNTTLIAGATQYQFIPAMSGQYKVIVTDARGCRGESALQTFTLNTFTASISPSKDSICDGDSLKFTASVGATYQWSTGATTQSIYAKSTGIYSVTVTNASGLTASASGLLKVNPRPNPTISQLNNSLQTQNTFMKYWWYKNGIIIDSNGYTYTPSLSGIYSVKVMDINKCIGYSSNFPYTKASLNSLNVKNPLILYQNNTINVDMLDAETYVYEVLDLSGKILKKDRFIGRVNIMLGNKTNMIYFLKLERDGYLPQYYKIKE